MNTESKHNKITNPFERHFIILAQTRQRQCKNIKLTQHCDGERGPDLGGGLVPVRETLRLEQRRLPPRRYVLPEGGGVGAELLTVGDLEFDCEHPHGHFEQFGIVSELLATAG